MVEDWESGELTDSVMRDGLIKWCDDSKKNKVLNGLARMITRVTVPATRPSTDPDLYRLASRKRNSDGSPHSATVFDSPSGSGGQSRVLFQPPHTTTAMEKWHKAIHDDMKGQIPIKDDPVAVAYAAQPRDIAAVVYGQVTVFVHPEMCKAIIAVILDKAKNAPVQGAGPRCSRASLYLIGDLLGLVGYKITKRHGPSDQPAADIDVND